MTSCTAPREGALRHSPTQKAGGRRAAASTLRVQAIEREHRAKLDGLRHNYVLRVTVERVQTLELYVPVQRFDVLIRRRKGERLIRLDWHPLVKAVEPPPRCTRRRSRVRQVCDDSCTSPSPQARHLARRAANRSVAPVSRWPAPDAARQAACLRSD
jgi:hypothetical protein